MNLKIIGKDKPGALSLVSNWLISLIFTGLQRLIGLFLVTFYEHLNISRQSASLPFITGITVCNIFGSLAQIFGSKCHKRIPIVLGCLISSVGVGLCFYGRSVTLLIIFWGIIFGAGHGLVSAFFPDEIRKPNRRNLPLALYILGPSLGSIILPLFFENLCTTYAFYGSFILLSGLLLNCIPLGLIVACNIRLPSMKWRSHKGSKKYFISKNSHIEDVTYPKLQATKEFSNSLWVNNLEPDDSQEICGSVPIHRTENFYKFQSFSDSNSSNGNRSISSNVRNDGLCHDGSLQFQISIEESPPTPSEIDSPPFNVIPVSLQGRKVKQNIFEIFEYDRISKLYESSIVKSDAALNTQDGAVAATSSFEDENVDSGQNSLSDSVQNSSVLNSPINDCMLRDECTSEQHDVSNISANSTLDFVAETLSCKSHLTRQNTIATFHKYETNDNISDSNHFIESEEHAESGYNVVENDTLLQPSTKKCKPSSRIENGVVSNDVENDTLLQSSKNKCTPSSGIEKDVVNNESGLLCYKIDTGQDCSPGVLQTTHQLYSGENSIEVSLSSQVNDRDFVSDLTFNEAFNSSDFTSDANVITFYSDEILEDINVDSGKFESLQDITPNALQNCTQQKSITTCIGVLIKNTTENDIKFGEMTVTDVTENKAQKRSETHNKTLNLANTLGDNSVDSGQGSLSNSSHNDSTCDSESVLKETVENTKSNDVHPSQFSVNMQQSDQIACQTKNADMHHLEVPTVVPNIGNDTPVKARQINPISNVNLKTPLKLKAHVIECTYTCVSRHPSIPLNIKELPSNGYRKHANSLPSCSYDQIDFITQHFTCVDSKKKVLHNKKFKPSTEIYLICEENEIDSESGNISRSNQNSQKFKEKTVQKLFTTPAQLLIDIILATQEFLLMIMFTIFSDLSKDIGIPLSFHKWILLAISVGEIFGRLSFHFVANRFSTRSNLLATICFVGICLTVFWIFRSSNFIYLSALCATFGIFESGISVTITQFRLPSMNLKSQSVSSPVNKFISGLAILTIPFIIGKFRDGLGSYTPVSYLMMCTCGFGAVLCLILPWITQGARKNNVQS